MNKNALEGLVVADFGQAWAGPHFGRTLADMGATVIKIESQRRMDVVRGLPPWPLDTMPTPNNSGYYNWLNRNKLGVTLNLTTSRGVEICKEILKKCDVLVENFSRGVMVKYGLDYASVKEINPKIIYVALTAFGSDGPYRDYVMYGRPQIYISGLAETTGHPENPPHAINISWGDPVGAHHAAFAMLSALRYRKKTGKGQYIGLSQWETLINITPENIMDYTLNKNVRTRQGNKHEFMAPHNAYKCAGGDLKWVTIAVENDEQWEKLVNVMGTPDWAKGEKFQDALSRWENQEEMDGHIEEWTINYTQYEITEMLQKEGIAAFPTLSNRGLTEDPHLNERGFFIDIDHPDPEMKGRKYDGFLWKMDKTPPTLRYRAPFPGEHNNYVLGEMLGMPQEEIDKLTEEKVLY